MKVVSIVGMHRSGTSMLTGSLEEAGLYIGDVNIRGRNNKKGNRESPYLIDFHDELLVKNGGSWDRPPLSVKWRESDRQELIRYVETFSEHQIWGFKDPRTLFVVDGWRELIPNLQFVGIFRNPVAVAKSLQKRNNFKIQRGLNLWKMYNRKLLSLFEESPFPIIEFVNKPKKLEQSIQIVAKQLGLQEKESYEFFTKKLVHHLPEEDLPNDVKQIYKRLKRISL